jgi:inorganic pyrophosphatase
LEAPVVPGCIVRVRLLGVIEALQKEKGGELTRNDRLMGVATHAQTHQSVKNFSGLRPHLLDEIKAFFVDYNFLADIQLYSPIASQLASTSA